MSLKIKEPDHQASESTVGFVQINQVAGGFGHFLPAQVEHAVVHPDSSEGHSIRSFRLGYLVLMVREDQIASAAVDIKGLTQISGSHGGAFDVPSGPAGTPG